MIMRITQQQEYSFIWGSNEQKCIEDNLSSSYEAKHNLTTPSTNCAPRHILSLSENLYPHENCTQMFKAALLIFAKTKATKMS